MSIGAGSLPSAHGIPTLGRAPSEIWSAGANGTREINASVVRDPVRAVHAGGLPWIAALAMAQ